MGPDNPEPSNLRREHVELFADGVEERRGAAVPCEEGRRVLTAHGIGWMVVERRRKVAPVDVEQGCR